MYHFQGTWPNFVDASNAEFTHAYSEKVGSSLAQELQALLAQPLQARFSRKFFTGVPSASLAAGGGGVPSSAAPEEAVEAPYADEEAAEPGQNGASEAPAAAAADVAGSVRLAQQMADSRTAAKVRSRPPNFQ